MPRGRRFRHNRASCSSDYPRITALSCLIFAPRRFLPCRLRALLAGCSDLAASAIDCHDLGLGGDRQLRCQRRQSQRPGGGRRAARGPDRRRHPGPGRQRRRCGHRHVLRPDARPIRWRRDWAAAASAWCAIRRRPCTRVRFPAARRQTAAAPMRCRARCAAFTICRSRIGACPGSAMSRRGEAYAATGFPISHALALRLASAAERSCGWMRRWRRNFWMRIGTPRAGRHGGDQSGACRRPWQRSGCTGADGFYTGAVAAQLIALFRGAGRRAFPRTNFPAIAPLVAGAASGERAASASLAARRAHRRGRLHRRR